MWRLLDLCLKTGLFSHSTYFRSSQQRSAHQKPLLAYILKLETCRIPPNGAHSEVSQNLCAGIQRISVRMWGKAPASKRDLRRRHGFAKRYVSPGFWATNTRSPKQPFFSHYPSYPPSPFGFRLPKAYIGVLQRHAIRPVWLKSSGNCISGKSV